MNVGWMIAFFAFGLTAGVATAAGVSAFLMKIGIFPRMIGTTHTIRGLQFYEWAVILGVVWGGVNTQYPQIPMHFGYWFVVVWGLLSGMFVGCVAVALSEVLMGLPIMFIRANIREGMSLYITLMALGKMCGAFWYFAHGLKP